MGKRIAIIGSGPAGLYAAEALSKSDQEIEIYIIEALFCPYGLVRSGVAPDHQKIKEVTKLFDKTLSKENVHFLGNVKIEEDLSLCEAKSFFDAIVLCNGAHKDRNMGIAGENLPGVHTATTFVGWYNCHPWFEQIDFDLNCENVSVIGQGNVAIDVSRILLNSINRLESSDISRHSLEILKASKVKNVRIIGRRGPLQAAFTDKELNELGELEDVFIKVDKDDLVLSEDEKTWLAASPKGIQRNYSILKDFSERTYQNQSKTLEILFFYSPKEFLGIKNLEKIILEKNILSGPLDKRQAQGSGALIELKSEMVLKSVGYFGSGLGNLPFDDKRGTYKHQNGRLLETTGFYTSGWIKRGPSGVVGTNKADSVETITQLLADLPSLPGATKSIEELYSYLKAKNIQIIDFPAWKILDSEEVRRGGTTSPRIKFRNNREALDFLNSR